MSIRIINYSPPQNWMRRIKTSHAVWLVKEEVWAQTETPWIPPEPGRRCGQITIRRVINNWLQSPETWFVGIDGKGLDSSQLMYPAEGHLADTEIPLSDQHLIYE